MALIFFETSECPLCEAILSEGDDLVATSHFIGDQSDSLWPFSDAAMHRACFLRWPLRQVFVARDNGSLGAITWCDGTYHDMQPDGTVIRKPRGNACPRAGADARPPARRLETRRLIGRRRSAIIGPDTDTRPEDRPMTRRTAAPLLLMMALWPTAPAAADGPGDNLPASVRRIPKLGIEVSPEVRREFEEGLANLRREIDAIPDRDRSPARECLPDVLVCHKAVADALKYQEFFAETDIAKARDLLALGRDRAASLTRKSAPWATQTGLVVRGYVSKIDGSVQPYGLVIPPDDNPASPGRYRLDVWFHGRVETNSEVNFLDERRHRPGEFTPADTIVLHPYGRFCNAFRFAGEVDVHEAIAAVRRLYRVDDDRVGVRGFSMGGAACWQFAVHDSDRWFAANPGAGFSETARFLKGFQNETLAPTPVEQALWHLYDATDLAGNLAQCPTVAYSGELDIQKQAADVMEEALLREGIALTHIIAPGTKHQYTPAARAEVEHRMDALAGVGRVRDPDEIKFTTYTLKYPRMNWLTVDALGEHWTRARIDARLDRAAGAVTLKTANVTALTLDFGPGRSPFAVSKPVRVTADGVTLTDARPSRSDKSWSLTMHQEDGAWAIGPPPSAGLRKRHDLQGPIDDAFMDSFLFVRPTGRSPNPAFQSWVDAELPRAIEHWRRQFRGEARVKDDRDVNDADVAASNLVLWGDPASNRLIAELAGKLPVRWDSASVIAGTRQWDSAHHALTMIYPNPKNPSRYVVLNSGFTYRDYDYLNNARQTPKLPDWAVIDLRTPPDARHPGKVVAAEFFGETWELKPPARNP